jgi:hypothetical protein
VTDRGTELVMSLRYCLSEAEGGISQAGENGEEETYCFGNLTHIMRECRSALRVTDREAG